MSSRCTTGQVRRVTFGAGLLYCAMVLMCEFAHAAPSTVPTDTPAVLAHIKILDSKFPRNRAAAAGALADDGIASPAVHAALKEATEDGDRNVRQAAADAMHRLWPDEQVVDVAPRPAVPPAASKAQPAWRPVNSAVVDRYRVTLNDSTASLSQQIDACQHLAAMGPDAAMAAPSLLYAMERPGPLRREAAATLKRLGPEAAYILAGAVADNNVVLAEAAADVLSDMGENARPVVRSLARLLKPSEPDRYRRIVGILQGLGPVAADATPALLHDLMNPEVNPPVSTQEIRTALRAIRPDDPADVIEAVFQLTRSPVWERVSWFIHVDNHYKLAIPAMLRQIGLTARQREAQETALEHLGIADEAELDALIENLKSPRCLGSTPEEETRIRRLTLVALKQMGLVVARAAPSLVDLLEDPEVGEPISELLGGLPLTDVSLVEKLMPFLSPAKDPGLRARSARVLAGFGPAATPALEPLIVCLRDGHRELQRAAASALAGLGPTAAPAVPDLIAVLKESDTASAAAADALAAIGAPAARTAVPALVIALQRAAASDTRVRQSCAKAVGLIDPDGEAAANLLLAAVRRKDWAVRETITPLLASSSRRTSLRPLLTTLTKDEDSLVRVNARCALREIERPPTPIPVTTTTAPTTGSAR